MNSLYSLIAKKEIFQLEDLVDLKRAFRMAIDLRRAVTIARIKLLTDHPNRAPADGEAPDQTPRQMDQQFQIIVH